MNTKELVKEAMVDHIISVGYHNRMEKLAREGYSDDAMIDSAPYVVAGMQQDGTLTKQAADEVITREIRRQLVLHGYYNNN